MRKRSVPYTENYQKLMAGLAAGRTFDEQLKCIDETRNHAPVWFLRAGLLKDLGIPAPKEGAENFLTFGCYVPFMSISKFTDTLKLLDILGIEYNYSPEKEICCGAPPYQDCVEFVDVTEEERQKIQARCKEYMQFNWDMGKQGGAKNMVYVCHACAALVKMVFPDDADTHRWVYDPIMDKLEEMTLEIAPTEIGYFQGCHKHFPYFGSLDWPRYRRVLDSIKGLTIVELDNRFCCKQQPDRILGEAEEKNLEAIVVPCGDGHYFLKQAAQGRIEVRNFSQLLLQVLEK